jgi:hypothetical protein
MIVVRTLKGGTDSFGQLVGREKPVSLYNPSFAMNPLGLHRIEPRALFGQQAAYDPHPFSTPFDRPVVRVDPLSHFMAYVPACVVPNQHPHLLTDRFKLLGAPIKKAGGYGAHRTAIHKTQPRLLKLGHIQPVAGDSLRIGIVLGDRLLDETQGFSLLDPAVKGRPCQPTPPALILEADHPGVGVVLREADQPVAPPFFLAYCGSGLVIQRLARSQCTPIRAKVARIVSPLTRSFVRPSSKLTWAAYSRVHRLLCLPNSRGLLCNNSRKASARSGPWKAR